MKYRALPIPEQQRTCHAKRVFLAEGVARSEAHRKGRQHGRRMKVYQCPNCLFWHLTSKKKAGTPRRSRAALDGATQVKEAQQ